jgi:hypothetical protein
MKVFVPIVALLLLAACAPSAEEQALLTYCTDGLTQVDACGTYAKGTYAAGTTRWYDTETGDYMDCSEETSTVGCTALEERELSCTLSVTCD